MFRFCLSSFVLNYPFCISPARITKIRDAMADDIEDEQLKMEQNEENDENEIERYEDFEDSYEMEDDDDSAAEGNEDEKEELASFKDPRQIMGNGFTLCVEDTRFSYMELACTNVSKTEVCILVKHSASCDEWFISFKIFFYS